MNPLEKKIFKLVTDLEYDPYIGSHVPTFVDRTKKLSQFFLEEIKEAFEASRQVIDEGSEIPVYKNIHNYLKSKYNIED